ncbi:MAG TPA: hypothetical protein VN442_15260 [Bryobacteraceae bacterium]|nr:hypothetical protein [Bryobacteraceae bacterium]
MARGWESKSVESQQADAAQSRKPQPEAKGPDPASLALIRKQETLLLSRTRIQRELETSQNPRYREMLNHALADLNTQLTQLMEASNKARAAVAS